MVVTFTDPTSKLREMWRIPSAATNATRLDIVLISTGLMRTGAHVGSNQAISVPAMPCQISTRILFVGLSSIRLSYKVKIKIKYFVEIRSHIRFVSDELQWKMGVAVVSVVILMLSAVGLGLGLKKFLKIQKVKLGLIVIVY